MNWAGTRLDFMFFFCGEKGFPVENRRTVNIFGTELAA
jgi:hypothetical protein